MRYLSTFLFRQGRASVMKLGRDLVAGPNGW